MSTKKKDIVSKSETAENTEVSELADVVDLGEVLAKPTEYKADTSSDTETDTTDYSEFQRDFEEGYDFEAHTHKIEEDVFDMPSEDIADLIIAGAETLGVVSLPGMYLRGYTTKEKAAIISISRKYDAGSADFTEYELEVMPLYHEYHEYTKSIPLSKSESDSLRKPLVKVLGKMNVKASPENALILSALMVASPRLLPIFLKSRK